MRNFFIIDLKYKSMIRNDYDLCVFYNQTNMKIETYYTETDICTTSALEVSQIGTATCE